MFWLEGRVVSALAGDDDHRTGGAITDYVASTLAAMPQHLRLGVALESVGLGAWTRIRYGSDPDDATMHRAIASWERAPIGLVQLYPRLLSSLVIFAQQELAQADEA
jgi:hypothetical protein